MRFTPFHRGGSGPPLVLLHGFMDTWRTWELVLPALERRHDVLALTLAGHAGGPPFTSRDGMVGAVEAAMDAAGMSSAHLAGNSLGGWIALTLAARDRARSVVALAPAGGWDDPDFLPGVSRRQLDLHAGLQGLTPETILATPGGRRNATASTTVAYEHIPVELLAHQARGVAASQAPAMVAAAGDYALDAERLLCPIRVVWGTHDALLPLPEAAVRYRRWLPHADWVELDEVGHAPQLDVPLETAQLILGITG